MSRVLKIVSVAVLIFLGFMWINVLTKSCNSSKEIEFPNQKVPTKPEDEFGKEDFFEEKDTIDQVSPTKPSDKAEPIDYTEIDKTIEQNKKSEKVEQTAPKEIATPATNAEKPDRPSVSVPIKNTQNKVILPKSSATSKDEVTTTNAKGKYVVIAGNYLVEGNADLMIKRLKKAGFAAEKVVFNLSEFHTVIVGRYADQSGAAKTAATLKAKGFDAYVQKPK